MLRLHASTLWMSIVRQNIRAAWTNRLHTSFTAFVSRVFCLGLNLTSNLTNCHFQVLWAEKWNLNYLLIIDALMQFWWICILKDSFAGDPENKKKTVCIYHKAKISYRRLLAVERCSSLLRRGLDRRGFTQLVW